MEKKQLVGKILAEVETASEKIQTSTSKSYGSACKKPATENQSNCKCENKDEEEIDEENCYQEDNSSDICENGTDEEEDESDTEVSCDSDIEIVEDDDDVEIVYDGVEKDKTLNKSVKTISMDIMENLLKTGKKILQCKSKAIKLEPKMVSNSSETSKELFQPPLKRMKNIQDEVINVGKAECNTSVIQKKRFIGPNLEQISTETKRNPLSMNQVLVDAMIGGSTKRLLVEEKDNTVLEMKKDRFDDENETKSNPQLVRFEAGLIERLKIDKIDIDKLIRQLLRNCKIEPGVDVLFYEDPEGGNHHASLLPNGKIQDHVSGQLFKKLHIWIKYLNHLTKRTRVSTVETEVRRIKYKDVPVWRLADLQDETDEYVGPTIKEM